MISIALVQPDIPQNTGNIGRLCTCLGMELALVHPLGFILDSREIKRSGMDYWDNLKKTEYPSLDDFLEQNKNLWFFTTKTKRLYTDVSYSSGDCLVFGSESRGLPQELLQKYPERCVTLPMPGVGRSLNVSSAVSAAAFEAYRQVRW